jgi:hypothetical protein
MTIRISMIYIDGNVCIVQAYKDTGADGARVRAGNPHEKLILIMRREQSSAHIAKSHGEPEA